MRHIRSAFLPGFLACAIPFLAVHAFTLALSPHAYFQPVTDGPAFLAATGMDWLTLDPLVVWHLPGYLWMQVSACILLLTGLPLSSLTAFQAAGMAFQGLWLVGASAWTGALCARRGIGFWTLFCAAALCAAMPTAMGYARLWGHNYPLSLMTVPLALGVYRLGTEDAPPPWVAFTTLAGLGFMVANFLAVVCVAAAVGVAFGVKALHRPVARRFFDCARPGRFPLALACLFFGLWALLNAGVYLLRIRFGGTFASPAWYAALGAVAAAATYGARTLLRRVLDRPGIAGDWADIVLCLVAGWLIGANVSAPFWGASFVGAALHKGGAASPLPFTQALSQLSPLRFFGLHAWNVLLLWAPLAALRMRRSAGAFPLLAVVLGVGLSLLLTFDVSFRIPAGFDVAANFGITPMRYYLGLPVLVAATALYALDGRFRLRPLLLAFFALVCLGSLYQYRANCVAAETLYAEGRALDARIDAHLARNPNNIAAVARLTLPRRAEVLYAYNNYRTPGRLGRIVKTSLDNGRFLYLDDMGAYASPDALREALRQLSGRRAGEALVLYVGERPFLSGFETERVGGVRLARVPLQDAAVSAR
ncbi:MAG TPA: hypothetical protein PKD41_07265 [Solidesulfovibrio sp.]|nr:hypothetical protein [Desulfovibrio sp.]HML60673.1 hypothetical protein [Solidesulfovibrio sp.]